MKSHKLATQIITTLVLVLGVAFAISGIILQYQADALLFKEIKKRGEIITEHLEYSLETVYESQNINALNRILQNLATDPTIETLAIVGNDNRIIAHSNRQRVSQLFDIEQFRGLKETVQKARHSTVSHSLFLEENESTRLIQVLPLSGGVFNIKEGRTLVMVVLNVTKAYNDIHKFDLFIHLMSLIILFFTTLSIYFVLNQKVVEPITQLLSSIQKTFSEGEYKPVKKLPNNEFIELDKDLQKTFSDLHELQDQLILSEQEVQTFLDDAPVMMWMTDEHGKVVLFNNTWLEYFNTSMEDEISLKWNEKNIHPDDRESILLVYNQAFNLHEKFHHEYRMKNASGDYRWISELGKPRFDDKEKFRGYIGTCIDFTEKKQADIEIQKHVDALAQSELLNKNQKEYYGNMIGNLSVPAFVIDLDHKVTIWNIACENMTGIKAKDLLGTDQHSKAIYKEKRPLLADLVIDSNFEKISELYPVELGETLMPGGYSVQNWVDMPNKNEPRYLAIDAGPVYDTNGSKTAVVQIMQDITSMKILEESLQQQTHELMKTNKELEQFAYVASHDLQEPLRMVSSYAQLLASRYKDKLDDDADEFIEYIVDGAKRMQTLIQDLLKFSRLSTQSEEFSSVDINNIFDYAVENLIVAIDETGTVVTSDELPVVDGDAGQLRLLFQNVIGNAVKYRDPEKLNKVHVSVEQKGKQWQFCIGDNGIGIESEYFEKIFVIFQRLHGKSEYQGTGIGLAICKKIVESHHGRIWLESEYGQGTRFYFTLPVDVMSESYKLQVNG